MPVFRVTDTTTGEHVLLDEPTDWDAWMHFKCLIHRCRHPQERGPMTKNFRAEAAPGGHHYAIERLAVGSGEVVEGTYLTFLPDGKVRDPACDALLRTLDGGG
jgi:hypothetical protein